MNRLLPSCYPTINTNAGGNDDDTSATIDEEEPFKFSVQRQLGAAGDPTKEAVVVIPASRGSSSNCVGTKKPNKGSPARKNSSSNNDDHNTTNKNNDNNYNKTCTTSNGKGNTFLEIETIAYTSFMDDDGKSTATHSTVSTFTPATSPLSFATAPSKSTPSSAKETIDKSMTSIPRNRSSSSSRSHRRSNSGNVSCSSSIGSTSGRRERRSSRSGRPTHFNSETSLLLASQELDQYLAKHGNSTSANEANSSQNSSEHQESFYYDASTSIVDDDDEDDEEYHDSHDAPCYSDEDVGNDEKNRNDETTTSFLESPLLHLSATILEGENEEEEAEQQHVNSMDLSTIYVSEEGAEVTVDLSMLHLNGKQKILNAHNHDAALATPVKLLRERSSLSLLDDDTSFTPTPDNKLNKSKDRHNKSLSPSTPVAPMICCSSVNCFSSANDILVVSDNNFPPVGLEVMQAKITKFLSDPFYGGDAWCHEWQAWSSFEFTPTGEHRVDAKEEIKQVLRNRAYDISARRRRLKTLRTNLYPFQNEHHIKHGRKTSPSSLNTSHIPRVTKANSFCITEHASAVKRGSERYHEEKSKFFFTFPSSCTKKNRNKSSTDTTNFSCSMWDSIPGCSGTYGKPISPDVFFRPAKYNNGIATQVGRAEHKNFGLSPNRSTSNMSSDSAVCYDSDPEDFMRRRNDEGLFYHKKKSNPNNTEDKENIPLTRNHSHNGSIDHSYFSNSNCSQEHSWEHQNHQYIRNNNFNNINPLPRSNQEDQDLETLLQEFFNEKFTFISHEQKHDGANQTSPTADKNKFHFVPRPSKSVAVHAWFERGQQLARSIIQPRLMWRSVNATNITAASSSTSMFGPTGKHASSSVDRNNRSSGRKDKKFKHSVSRITSIELIDISRILEVPDDNTDYNDDSNNTSTDSSNSNIIDRELYPFARSQNSFVIKTIDQTYLLEMGTKQERDRFVHLLKLLVARLASKILLGDETLVEEFFISPGATKRCRRRRCDKSTNDSSMESSEINSSEDHTFDGEDTSDNDGDYYFEQQRHFHGPGDAPYWANV